MHSLHNCLARDAHDAISRWRMAWRSRSKTRRTEDDARMSVDVWKQLTAQQKDERWQDNGDIKRLVRHHPSDLLSSLMREWIGGGQHGIISLTLWASPFWTFHVLHVRHMMCMHMLLFFVNNMYSPLTTPLRGVRGLQKFSYWEETSRWIRDQSFPHTAAFYTSTLYEPVVGFEQYSWHNE